MTNREENKVHVSQLQSQIAGRVIQRGAEDYYSAWASNWNQLRPERYADLIVQVANDRDVVEAINFARHNHLKVAVRGGGHAWCASPFRNRGMLIDLSRLTEVRIDAASRTAAIQPIISNRDLMVKLEPYQLAFPVGHCPQVKASGYLLSGEIAWNGHRWGPATLSVKAMEMATADGRLVTASADQNQELFWAARGAGAGMFAVVTRFHLALYPRPQAIYSSTYFYRLSRIAEVTAWFSQALEMMPDNVEMTLFLVSASPALADQCSADNGKVCMITATVFADTSDEAKTTLDMLERCPYSCLHKTVAVPTTFEEQFALSSSMWPEFVRAKVETLWSNASPAEMLHAVSAHFVRAPDPATLVLFALYPKWAHGVLSGEDMAFSMVARVYGGPWTMWKDARGR